MDFSDVIRGDTNKMKYVMILLTALFLSACGTEDNSDGNNLESTENSAAVMIRNMDLKSEGTTFTLTGEARLSDDELFFVIDQGDNRLLEEKSITLDGETADWVKFEIKETLPESVVDGENPPIITLYGKDTNDEMVNPNYIPVDFASE